MKATESISISDLVKRSDDDDSSFNTNNNSNTTTTTTTLRVESMITDTKHVTLIVEVLRINNNNNKNEQQQQRGMNSSSTSTTTTKLKFRIAHTGVVTAFVQGSLDELYRVNEMIIKPVVLMCKREEHG